MAAVPLFVGAGLCVFVLALFLGGLLFVLLVLVGNFGDCRKEAYVSQAALAVGCPEGRLAAGGISWLLKWSGANAKGPGDACDFHICGY